ncbi:MAG: fumarylacetoacetate hydrolase family protein [Alphaproteobacteria bacterium]|nr:MAG: fumarylacetoacetate hydrolase family protein [Alphaproteobacteria bacterium]
MRFATVEYQGKTFVASVDKAGKKVMPLSVGDINAVFRGDRCEAKGPAIALASVKLKAPMLPLRNIMCVGKNYHEHAKEFSASGFDSSSTGAADAIPTAPIIFTKVPQSVIGPDEPIRYPTGVSDQLDYEAELAVIIGQGGRGIAKSDALGHVWGYTIINDVTARDLQARHKQWFLGKSMDSFAPMGPWCVTADEVDLATAGIRCWVNGELRQDAKIADLIFDIPTLIATISAGITLMPGDIIATGTPAGVGIGFKPPKFLQKGDVVAMEVDGIGRLTNPVQ